MSAPLLRPVRFQFDERAAIHRLGAMPGKRLANKRSATRLVKNVRSASQAAKARGNPPAGFRIERMFEALTASLGQVCALKTEDAGHVYTNRPDVKAPDFRVVVADGQQFLVEVKRCKQRTRIDEFLMSAKELDALATYASLYACELRLAVYCARANLWTLVNPYSLGEIGANRRLKLIDALSVNEMHVLGDALVATLFPLRLRILCESGEQTVGRVESVQLFCQDRLIARADERKIALFLMLFGRWAWRGPVEAAAPDGSHGVVFEATPTDDQRANPDQPFENIGFLSEIFSRHYRNVTQDRAVRQRQFSPIDLGHLVPDAYSGESLPLWRFIVEPSEEARGRAITEVLDRTYRHETSEVDPILAAMQIASLPQDDW